MIDILFINSNAPEKIYQELAKDFTAIEPPTWSLLLAEACRKQGYSVAILDCDAERLDNTAAIERIKYAKPRLACFVVYGQNPNSGTTNMEGNLALAKELKLDDPTQPVMFIGSHASALPNEVLGYDYVDFVAINEGVKCLFALLSGNLKDDLDKVPALGWKKYDLPTLNSGIGSLVAQNEMDELMPGYAWDLLPYREKPLDLYRSHNWLTGYNDLERTPYAGLYTTLGCSFKCNFCMISIINRTTTNETDYAGNFSGMRYWSPEFVLRQMDKLIELGVTTYRFCDELYFLNKKHYEPILKGLINRGYGKFIKNWAYSRIDTTDPKHLELFAKSGIKFLGLGIESANQVIRKEITKGKFTDINIKDVVRQVESYGIDVGANFIFGFPNEQMEHLQQTLDLSIELNTAFANYYCCTALPGSELYWEAINNKWELPKTYSGYGFLSYDHLPLRTNYLTAAEVLKFRDDAWYKYYKRPEYLSMIEKKFGLMAKEHIEKQLKIKLRRKLLEQ